MRVEDLGTMPYREAWEYQEKVHTAVLEGGEERLLLVEHPPVITFGRRPGVAKNLLASEEHLAGMGVEVVQSDRGGDITFHGPGQIVAYPIVRLADHGLTVSGYVHRLEDTVVDALVDLGVDARRDVTAVGVWTEHGGEGKKICALGVRIRRGVSLHGVALNVTTDLRYFDLIVPCGLTAKKATSLREVMGEDAPSFEEAKAVLARHLVAVFTGAGW